jgi:hypothetical protein
LGIQHLSVRSSKFLYIYILVLRQNLG